MASISTNANGNRRIMFNHDGKRKTLYLGKTPQKQSQAILAHVERLFHLLRATRQSELAELYPAHVVSAWIGNSVKVAEKHYLMVNDGHFERATQKTTQTPSATTRQAPTPEDAEA